MKGPMAEILKWGHMAWTAKARFNAGTDYVCGLAVNPDAGPHGAVAVFGYHHVCGIPSLVSKWLPQDAPQQYLTALDVPSGTTHSTKRLPVPWLPAQRQAVFNGLQGQFGVDGRVPRVIVPLTRAQGRALDWDDPVPKWSVRTRPKLRDSDVLSAKIQAAGLPVDGDVLLDVIDDMPARIRTALRADWEEAFGPLTRGDRPLRDAAVRLD